ncbi:MAG: hypothetical protein Q8L27_00770 [archaeon]|nr:hypothetical protein [archaeon]
MKTKKAQQEGFSRLITIIIVMIVVALVIYAMFRFGIVDTLKNVIPGFENPEFVPKPGDISTQPSELRNEDSCIETDFFWSDKDGNELVSPPKTVEEGTVYIAIKFNDHLGDLNDEKNPNYEKCGDYQVAVYLTDLSSSWFTKTKVRANEIQQITFPQIQKYSIKKIKDKDYYIIPVDVRDPGAGYHGEYSFKIENKPSTLASTIRQGSIILVE